MKITITLFSPERTLRFSRAAHRKRTLANDPPQYELVLESAFFLSGASIADCGAFRPYSPIRAVPLEALFLHRHPPPLRRPNTFQGGVNSETQGV